MCEKIHKQEHVLQMLNENVNASQNQVNLLLDLSQMGSEPITNVALAPKGQQEILDR